MDRSNSNRQTRSRESASLHSCLAMLSAGLVDVSRLRDDGGRLKASKSPKMSLLDNTPRLKDSGTGLKKVQYQNQLNRAVYEKAIDSQ